MTCTDYDKLNSNYDECVKAEFGKQLVEIYGCQDCIQNGLYFITIK